MTSGDILYCKRMGWLHRLKEGLKLEYTDANWDPIKQLTLVEDLVPKK